MQYVGPTGYPQKHCFYHNNVEPRYHSFARGLLGMTLEFMNRGSLRKYLTESGGRLRQREVVHIGFQIRASPPSLISSLRFQKP